MNEKTIAKYHVAAKIIEIDGVEGYNTCRNRYGQEWANLLLIAHLRRVCNPTNQWPASEDLVEKVNKILRDRLILENQDLNVMAVKSIINDENKTDLEKAKLIVDLMGPD